MEPIYVYGEDYEPRGEDRIDLRGGTKTTRPKNDGTRNWKNKGKGKDTNKTTNKTTNKAITKNPIKKETKMSQPPRSNISTRNTSKLTQSQQS